MVIYLKIHAYSIYFRVKTYMYNVGPNYKLAYKHQYVWFIYIYIYTTNHSFFFHIKESVGFID